MLSLKATFVSAPQTVFQSPLSIGFITSMKVFICRAILQIMLRNYIYSG